MPSTNGHGPKRAILYARVSTDEQARSGYSLAQQLEALRDYANREGYEVLEEVQDPGQSGASLERPGMDRVRDLVAVGGVSVVLAQDRDRFAREPAYHYLLRREFEEYGTKIRALNDRGDDSPEGELTDGILDQLAKFERAKIAERSRRGKLRKAREGKIMVTMKPPYGFRYNATRDGLDVYEPEMTIVERIFRMAAEGLGTAAIQTRLYRENVPAPLGGEVWHRTVIRRLVLNDLYRPHAFGELSELVAPEVAARLDSEKDYGVRWSNRQAQKTRQVSEAAGEGRRYRKRVTATARSRKEWVAIPVPAYLPRELVEQARAMMEAQKPTARKYLARQWELRGLICCSCGVRMGTSTTTHGRAGGGLFYYYKCSRRSDYKRGVCQQRSLRAERVEARVWEFISGLLKDPENISRGMQRMIELERQQEKGDPERDAAVWVEKLAEVDQERRTYLRLAAKGHMTDDELDEALAELEETRNTAERELPGLRSRQQSVETLEGDRDRLLKSMAEMVPEKLDNLSGEDKNRLYRL